MRSYEAARSLFSFLAFCAWAVVIIGVLVALIGAGGGSRYGGAGAGLLAMAPGIGIGISGLILVAFVQMGRAGVDTAEYTQQMLKIARDQLEVSKQSLNPGGTMSKSFSSIQKKEDSPIKSQAPMLEPKESTPTVIKEESFYRGRRIRVNNDKYVCDGREFETLISAKEHIEKIDGTFLEKAPLT